MGLLMEERRKNKVSKHFRIHTETGFYFLLSLKQVLNETIEDVKIGKCLIDLTATSEL